MKNLNISRFWMLLAAFLLSAPLNCYSQDTSGSAALGKALGTLIGNFLRDDGPAPTSPQGSFSNASSTQPENLNNDAPTKSSMDAFKLQNEVIQQKIKDACQDDRYRAYFIKSPCKSTEITMLFLTDTSKPTPKEKEVIKIVDVPFIEVSKLQIANYRDNIKPTSLGISMGSLLEKSTNLSQENLLNLYKGKLTWGEYNEIRKNISIKAKAEFDGLNK